MKSGPRSDHTRNLTFLIQSFSVITSSHTNFCSSFSSFDTVLTCQFYYRSLPQCFPAPGIFPPLLTPHFTCSLIPLSVILLNVDAHVLCSELFTNLYIDLVQQLISCNWMVTGLHACFYPASRQQRRGMCRKLLAEEIYCKPCLSSVCHALSVYPSHGVVSIILRLTSPVPYNSEPVLQLNILVLKKSLCIHAYV